MKYTKTNKPPVCMMTQSTCYQNTHTIKVLGVLWHSTGANNPKLKRYVQPDDNASNKAEWLNKLGVNDYKNDYNHIKSDVMVNAFIGKYADGSVGAVQTMNWDYRPWGCGKGSRGSCNDGWIQFEICEDNLRDANYFNAIFEEGCQLTAYLCDLYGIDPNGTVTFNGVKVPTIICHADSHAYGLGSNHGDVLHWFKNYGKTMGDVRARVTAILDEAKPKPAPAPSTSELKVGSLVFIAPGAKYWTGSTVPSWIQSQKWYVQSIGSNGRVVINKNEKGDMAIMSPIDKKYLTVVGASSSAPSTPAFKEYRIKVTVPVLNYRAGPADTYKINGKIYLGGVYTIVDEKIDSRGRPWGKLKSGAGWIFLRYTKKV